MSIYPPTGTLEIKNATLKIPVVDLQYTSNTAKLEANSNVVTEFSRSKKLIKYPRVAMTQNDESGTSGYVASASSQESTNRQAWKVFNNTYAEGDGWRSAQSYASDGSFTGTFVDFSSGGQTFIAADKGEWLKITLPEKMRLERFRLQPRYSPTTGGATYSYGRSEFVKNGAIWGSNDGSSWDKVYTITHGVPATDTTITEFTVPNSTTTYNNFVLVVTDTHGSSAGLRTSFSEWELLGVPEYDPEADGTDVTLKSLANVPNTDWLEVYFDAKGLPNGAVTNPISGLGGTTINGTATNVTVSDGAFVFNGNQYIQGDTGLTGNFTHSISMWFNASHDGQLFWTGINANSGDRMNIFFSDDGGEGGATTPQIHYTFKGHTHYANVNPNQWNHLVCTYSGTDSSNRKIYLNGVETGADTATDGTGATTHALNVQDSTFYINKANYMNGTLVGKIANFRLFNRAITQDEVWQLYAYQKEDFGYGDLSMTLKAGRLGIGTSEPRAALDVRGRITREYNPGEIIETIQGKANGRDVKVQSGTYLLPNVGNYQDLTSTHTRITGSNFDYTPPPGTTRVIYEFWCYLRQGDNRPICHFQGRVDGTIVNDSRHTYRDNSEAANHDPQFWIYNHMCISIGEVSSDNIAGGQVAAWNGPRTIDFTAREYSGDYEGRLHKTNHWDGSGSDILVRPTIKITAIA